jgi:hypothetical protein
VPLTLAHPAAVLPLRGLGLPLAAMVIGSMVPDIPLFARSLSAYQAAHSLVGILTLDLAAALVVLGFWDLVARDALVDLSPAVVRDRLPATHRLSRREWLLAPLAAVVGSATHVGWDLFTHHGRWGVRHVPWLQEVHGPLRGEQWAQYASGILGLLVVGAACAAHVWRRPVVMPARPRRLPGVVLPGAFAASCVLSGLDGVAYVDHGLHAAAFHAAITGIVAAAGAIVLVTAAWVLARPAVRV